MCDTLTATAEVTAGGAAMFGKNSDRERNEAQGLEVHPAATHAPGSRLRCTYIEIDQARRTHAVLLSRPFWMWGAEMGANEHGVVIGNEAMHAVILANRRRALIGMDLVRLGLERAATAAEAVQVITTLLECHGQGGDCGHLGRFYYQNGFVIADPNEAYVLETVGRWWAVEKVAGVRTLSNALSIGREPHAISDDLRSHAKAEGWVDQNDGFDFAERLIDPVRDAGTFGRGRCARTTSLLAPRAGRLSLGDIQAALRDHGAEADGDPDWSPRKTTHRSICMHAAAGARRSQTVASMTSDLTPGRITHWLTGTAAPCLSLFKPVVLGHALPPMGPSPSDRYDPDTLWWRHEQLHRAALDDFPAAMAMIADERDKVEVIFRERMNDAWREGDAAVSTAVKACWDEAVSIERRWTTAITGARQAGPSVMGRSVALSWARLNGVAGFRPE